MHLWENTGTCSAIVVYNCVFMGFFLKEESQIQEDINPHSQEGTWVCEKVLPFGFEHLICHLDKKWTR